MLVFVWCQVNHKAWLFFFFFLFSFSFFFLIFFLFFFIFFSLFHFFFFFLSLFCCCCRLFDSEFFTSSFISNCIKLTCWRRAGIWTLKSTPWISAGSKIDGSENTLNSKSKVFSWHDWLSLQFKGKKKITVYVGKPEESEAKKKSEKRKCKKSKETGVHVQLVADRWSVSDDIHRNDVYLNICLSNEAAVDN